MGIKKIILIITASFLFFAGCGYDLVLVPKQQNDDTPKTSDLKLKNYYPNSAINPIVLTHADFYKKKAYILNTKIAVEQFRLFAHDTRKFEDNLKTEELGREANKYIKMYVDPIIHDNEVIENPETKAEIAKLYLLSAWLYYDLARPYQAKYYLDWLNGRFGGEYLSAVTTEQGDDGFITLAEGIEKLRKKISTDTSS
jgi:hypothetical protein